DEASVAKVYEINIPSSQVQILDPDSEFWLFWKLSVIVADNVTFDPIEAADVMVYGSNLEMIAEGKTVFDGSFMGYIPILKMMGQTVVIDYNPINITIEKTNYVPYWGGDETMSANIDRTVLLSENRPPQLPQEHEPAETHQKRPTIMWGDAYDWNMDVVNYKVNVYMDELYTGDQIVEDVIVRPSEYTFTKNLRYNRVYWVEIEAFDPWGLTDSIIFSFETTNTAPTTPNIGFLSTPVSTRDDITVVVLNASTDIDTDPIDDISYLVEWYAFKENSWVLLASGINLTTLPADKTSEGEEIKVIVKPYDGIEYGIGATLTTPVVNFVPEVISVPLEITMNEDEVGINLVDLNTLFLDRDGDDLAFRVRTERHVLASIDQVTNNVTFTPDPNWVGTDYVIIEAFDTKVHEEAWPTIRINITVEPVNDPPIITLLNERSVGIGETILVQGVQGSTQIISVEALDPDEIYGDTWTFDTNFLEMVGEGVVPQDDFQFEGNTGRLSVFLSNALVGEIFFNITVTDEWGESSTVQVRLIVDNTNDEMTDPEIISPLDGANLEQAIGEGISFQAAECYDPDFDIPNSNERLTYEWYFSDGDEITNAGTAVTHRFGVTGNYTIRLLVRDSFGAEKETSIKIFVNVLEEDRDPIKTPGEDNSTFIALIIILVVIAIIFLAVLFFFIFRKDPLADTAEAEEQAHEALVAQQQQDALVAQERLQALLSGAAYEGVSGPALPSAEAPDLEALPAAPTEEYPAPEPPTEAYPEQPQFEAPPMSEPPVEQPQYEPGPEPVPETAPEPVQPPMQAAPAGTVPMPEEPPAQGNLPAPEEQQQ
ncbi:MAG: PKD domain-containing protein, partial [Thermoplasmatota archaeon]